MGFWRREKRAKVSPEQALAARPVRLVAAEMVPTDQGGGRLTVRLKPGRMNWLFKIAEGSTKTFEFDSIGVFVWESADGKMTVKQLIRKLAERHRLSLREAEVPTLAFLRTLTARGLIGMRLPHTPGETVSNKA